MFFKLFFLLICTVVSTQDTSTGSLKVTLVYKPPCPYCKNFIINQLYKTWRQFRDKVEWELVLGLSESVMEQCRTNSSLTLCVLYDLHICGINQTCGTRGTVGCPVENLNKAMEYIFCMEKNPGKVAKCTQDSGVDVPQLKFCRSSQELPALWNFHYQLGNSADSYPYLMFNNVHNETMEDMARNNLTSVICQYQPKLC